VVITQSNPRFTYTVYADCGVGEFLWRKETEDKLSTLVGGNLYSLMDVGHESEEMSPQLFEKFCDWARFYMACDCDGEANTRNIDWDSFNARGLDLAQQLKNELSASADVYYSYAWDDPRRDTLPVLLQVTADRARLPE
jgi:hypothetical protein